MIAYQAPGKAARPTPAWASFILLWTFWLIANLAALPVILAVMLPRIMHGQTQPTPHDMGLIILLTLYVMFVVFAACVLVWVKVYERRDFASIGLVARHALPRYGRGLFYGTAFALTLIALAALSGNQLADKATPEHGFSWAPLLRPGSVLVFAALILGLLVQSAAEEIICRGWVLSSVALRHGRAAAIAVSALFFGSLHVHLLILGYMHDQLLAGAVAISAITLMGVMLGLYALQEGAIIGAAGLHGAFNALVFGFTLALLIGTGKAADPLSGLNAAYQLSTKPQTLGPESFAQGALALAVSLLLWRRLTGRRAGAPGANSV